MSQPSVRFVNFVQNSVDSEALMVGGPVVKVWFICDEYCLFICPPLKKLFQGEEGNFPKLPRGKLLQGRTKFGKSLRSGVKYNKISIYIAFLMLLLYMCYLY